MSIGGVPELRANFLLHRDSRSRPRVYCGELSRVELNDDVCPSKLILWDETQGSALDRLISFVHIHACTSDGQSKSREFNLLRPQIVSSFVPKVTSRAVTGLRRNGSERTAASCVNFELQSVRAARAHRPVTKNIQVPWKVSRTLT